MTSSNSVNAYLHWCVYFLFFFVVGGGVNYDVPNTIDNYTYRWGWVFLKCTVPSIKSAMPDYTGGVGGQLRHAQHHRRHVNTSQVFPGRDRRAAAVLAQEFVQTPSSKPGCVVVLRRVSSQPLALTPPWRSPAALQDWAHRSRGQEGCCRHPPHPISEWGATS